MSEASDSAAANVVYVLGSGDARRYVTYVGWTNDLARRVAQHNAGKGARSTRGRSWVVLHVETFATREQAMSREWYLKRDRAFRRQLVERHRSNVSSGG
ncbi:MAG: GIY-YIG nuclease family protein [Xanthobacteraceae bacterium]|nr:GIY-YIG nuclease family protein [Xanthobacteraceae bacterium]